MNIPNHIRAITELKLTIAGQVELSPFSETAISEARRTILSARGISNHFAYFRSLAFKYDTEKGITPQWKIMYELREQYGVKDTDKKYTGLGERSTLKVERVEDNPLEAAEIVIKSLKEKNFEAKVRLGLTSNPWWKLISPEDQRVLLNKFPWYSEFVTEPQERSGIALMLEEVSQTIVEKKSDEIVQRIDRNRIPRNKTVYTPRPLPKPLSPDFVITQEDIDMLW